MSAVMAPHLRSLIDRRLSAEELHALADTPLTHAEVAETLALVRWFTRRYPAAEDRLAYVRKRYAAWTRGR